MSRTELLDEHRSAVLVIDLQGKILERSWRSGLVIAATQRLLDLAGIFQRPVVLTEQYPERLAPTHPEVRATYDALETPKRYVKKMSFGCCGEPAFMQALDELLPDVPPSERQLVVAGIEAHVCVMQTTLELLAAGSSVHLCWECVSGRGEEYRRHALERMQQAGAVVTNYESVAFEWARTKEHPAFKEVNRLLRQGQIVG